MKENDIISAIKRLDVPILLISGELDYICPVPTTKEWFGKLVAPKKDFVVVENASHMVNFEQPNKWNQLVCSCLGNDEKQKETL